MVSASLRAPKHWPTIVAYSSQAPDSSCSSGIESAMPWLHAMSTENEISETHARDVCVGWEPRLRVAEASAYGLVPSVHTSPQDVL